MGVVLVKKRKNHVDDYLPASQILTIASRDENVRPFRRDTRTGNNRRPVDGVLIRDYESDRFLHRSLNTYKTGISFGKQLKI